MKNSNYYCIILAGGVGRRLWPTSRSARPKQFIDFLGVGRTLLQLTYDRFARFIPQGNIYVSTFEGYADLVREQLPELTPEQIICEPVQLSTGPATAWASWHIFGRNQEACIVSSPSDQFITNEAAFERCVLRGLGFVATSDSFLALGVKATAPRTSYGYIQRGEPAAGVELSSVKSFTEKPAEEYARMFVESGEFLWNTGLFLWNVRTMMAQIGRFLPDFCQRAGAIVGPLPPEEERRLMEEFYPQAEHRAIDLAILDGCGNVYVQECDFGWSDVGCWPQLLQSVQRDADGNGVVGSAGVTFAGCTDTLVSLPHGVVAVVKGLKNYLVAYEKNVVVICPNDDPAQMSRTVNEMRLRMGDDFA